VALFAAITLPAIGHAVARARNAAIKTEIDMLHMAMMAYRNEYGSFPPAYVPSIAAASPTDAASRHLQRIFPRIVGSGTQACGLSYQNVGVTAKVLSGTAIGPDTALTMWLFGYSDSMTMPVFNATGGPPTLAGSTLTITGTAYNRKKFYDFDMARVISGTAAANQCQFFAPNKPGSPYVYIPAGSNYLSGGAVVSYVIGTGTYYGHRVPLSTAPSTFTNTSQPPFNPDTFQILSAGRDEIFGTDDDLSNFWPSTRQDYIDSLSN